MDLKECVVRLEKLRITPLKKRSRSYERSAIITEDVSSGSKGTSQLSFAVSFCPGILLT